MIAECCSVEEWQRAKTLEWMQRLLAVRPILGLLFEGQTQLAFLDEGGAVLRREEGTDVRMVEQRIEAGLQIGVAILARG